MRKNASSNPETSGLNFCLHICDECNHRRLDSFRSFFFLLLLNDKSEGDIIVLHEYEQEISSRSTSLNRERQISWEEIDSIG